MAADKDNQRKEKNINTSGEKIDILGIKKYKDGLDILQKQIKEKNNAHVEEKEAKRMLYKLVKDAYTILIYRLGYKIDSFKTRLEVQLLNNDIKTKKLLRNLQNEILASHNAKKEKNDGNIEVEGRDKTAPNKAKTREQINGYSRVQAEEQIDNQTLLEKVESNRIFAGKRVEKYIDSVSGKASGSLREIIGRLTNKAK